MHMFLHSGGLDSLAAIYYALKNTDRPVHLLHVRFSDTPAAVLEFIAVYKQRKWLESNVRPITYYTATARRRPDDIDDMTQWPLAYKLGQESAKEFVRLDDKVTTISTGRCKEDEETFEMYGYDNNAFGISINLGWNTVLPDSNYTDYRELAVTRDWYKREMVEYMPLELAKLAVGCTQPNQVTLSPCGECERCLKYKEIGIL